MAKHNVWMSVSDLMTGLMVIFLFVAIAYISRVQKNTNVLSYYVETRTKLHDQLVNEFKGDTSQWQMSVGKEDLSMRFNNPTTLFKSGSADLTPEFRLILDKFIPRYLHILLTSKLRNKIKEIRIEGHTDNWGYPQLNKDPYVANVILSQQRALNVLIYIRQMPIYKQYKPEEKALLAYWFTANGLSYGKALDKDGNYTMLSKHPIDKVKSRRVEFRIVTTGDEILQDFVKKNQ